MINERLLLLILACVQFTHVLDFMIIMPLGAQFMEIFGINPQQFSMIVSAYAVTAFFTGLFGAMYIDRFDRKHVLLFTYLGFAIGTIACSAANSYQVFLIARCVTGGFGGILGALVYSIVADVVPLERRSSAMGIVMTAFSVAAVLGVPAGIYLAAEFNWRVPFLAVGILAFVVGILAWFVMPAIRIHLENGLDRTPPLKVLTQIAADTNQRRALLFTIFMMLGHFTIIPFIAPYMQLNIGFSDYDLTYIYAIGGTLSAIMLPLIGRIADRVGNYRTFFVASFLALFSILAITHLPPVGILLALCATSSYFVVAGGRTVPAATMVTSVVRPENRGSFMSVRSSVNEMGLALSSLIAGLIIVETPEGTLDHYNYVGYFAVGMSLIAVWLGSRLRAVS